MNALNFVKSFAAPVAKAAAPAAALSSSSPPKRPLTAFFMYLESVRNAPSYVPMKKGSEEAKRLGAAWNALSPADRASFQTESRRKLAQWKSDTEAWVAEHGPIPAKLNVKYPRRRTAYQVFFKDTRPTILGDFGTVSAEVSRRWKGMDESAKASFVTRAEAETEKMWAAAEAEAEAARAAKQGGAKKA